MEFLLFFFVFSLFAGISPAASYSQEYAACRRPLQLDCGGRRFNISYPFSTEDRPEFCGFGSNFRIRCEDGGDSALIDIGESRFHVESIDYEARIMKIRQREGKCPSEIDETLIGYISEDQIFPTIKNCSIRDPYLEEIPFCGRSYILRENLLAELKSFELKCAGVGRLPAVIFFAGFEVRWRAGESWCGDCTRSGGICGYNSSSPEDPLCFCSEGSSTTATCRMAKGWSLAMKISIGLGAGIGGILISSLFFFFLYKRKEAKMRPNGSKLLSWTNSLEPSSRKDLENGTDSGAPFFRYEELHDATDGFNPSNELGDGGFGTVYKGKLRDGRIVAVKRLYENNFKRVEQFMNEAAILNRLRHPNLVSLYGCTSRHSRELLLVYEFVPNGTVADHLHGHLATRLELNWPLRLRIALETATALSYLHAAEPQIIHRDIKTNNILLDANFHVKVADFGLSRLFPMDVTHVSTAPQGTPGYVDPEYHQCYQLTDKSDVYSFGVVLVELISSMPAVDITRHRNEINLSSMAVNRIQSGQLGDLVDPRLGFDSDPEVRGMVEVVAELAFRCLQSEKEMRPSMEEAVEVLLGVSDGGDKERETTEAVKKMDEVVLLKAGVPPLSPESVMHKWSSRVTTPNASE